MPGDISLPPPGSFVDHRAQHLRASASPPSQPRPSQPRPAAPSPAHQRPRPHRPRGHVRVGKLRPRPCLGGCSLPRLAFLDLAGGLRVALRAGARAIVDLASDRFPAAAFSDAQAQSFLRLTVSALPPRAPCGPAPGVPPSGPALELIVDLGLDGSFAYLPHCAPGPLLLLRLGVHDPRRPLLSRGFVGRFGCFRGCDGGGGGEGRGRAAHAVPQRKPVGEGHTAPHGANA